MNEDSIRRDELRTLRVRLECECPTENNGVWRAIELLDERMKELTGSSTVRVDQAIGLCISKVTTPDGKTAATCVPSRVVGLYSTGGTCTLELEYHGFNIHNETETFKYEIIGLAAEDLCHVVG